jgi:TolB-like protein/class 3 adenylate cyclase/Flp pilus assembly protein TadD
LSVEETSAKQESDLEAEIAHILLIDVVGYSQLLMNEQVELLQHLNQIVRGTAHFRRAETAGRLTRLPTGDGMALLFFHSPEEPAQCALEISAAVKTHPKIQLRMGVHSGPVNRVTDVNDQVNVAGAGINVAQRVMDCGDAGHILLSKRIADDLSEYRHWSPYLHDLGECAVKHGRLLHIVNLYKDGLGNADRPEKLRRRNRWKAAPPASVWPRRALLTVFLLISAAVIAAGVWFIRARSSSLPGAIVSAISEKSIAVLPFENLSSNQQNAFFADGVQNEIVTDLARVADLKVISRTSVMQYKDVAARNIRQIANELGVAHVVEGTVQRSDGTVRVSAQLIDARTDAHLWAETYDRSIADVFAIETELAKQIVAQLKAKLSVEEQAAMEKQPTRDIEAYTLYLRAKDLINAIAFSPRGKESLFEAIILLEDAVRRDRDFGRAYYELARAHDQIYFLGFDHTPARLSLADSAIQSLLRLAPDSGEAHLAQAQHAYWGYRHYARAREELTKARQALPNEPLALLLLGYIDRREGRWNESISAMEQALAIDPRNAFILQQLSFTYSKLRRFTEQAAALDKVLTIIPDDINTRVERAQVELNSRGDTEPLRAVIAAVTKEGPQALADAADPWRTLALCTRDPEMARQALDHTSAEGTDNGGFHYPKAWWEGLMARALHDETSSQTAFARARAEMETLLQSQPDYGPTIALLGIIDASLGRKDDAIREGRRAVELLPLSKDSFGGTEPLETLAAIYAWVGEKELACDQLEVLANSPSGVNYGQLRLHPVWDPLRGDPCFEKIVSSLAPKP